MEDEDPSQKEPQDTIRQTNIDSNKNIIQQTSSETAKKIEVEDNNNTKYVENGKKINENDIIHEALDHKSMSIINLANELDGLLTRINNTWENYREGFAKYYSEEIKPKFNELLSYPCITSNQEKVILIFSFFCKYFFSRINFLKEIPKEEIFMMLSIIYCQNCNIFSIHPNTGGSQEYELIEDKYLYQVFKEILPNKEVENSYGTNNNNCCYKYFMEFIFQSGFVDNYINDILLREDFISTEFTSICGFPGNLLHYCDKNFILKKNWNIKIIQNINYRINYYLSEKNPFLNNDGMMNHFSYWISIYYFNTALGVFNHAFDELITNNLKDCQIYALMIFRINEFLIKSQKINLRMAAMQNISCLCDNYLKFGKKAEDFTDYIKKYDEAEKIYEFLVKMGIGYLAQIKIFDLIFGENIHEGVIQRSFPTLSLLYKNKAFNSSHIQILWNLSQTKYQSISNAIISLFGNLLPEFSIEDCNSILKIVDKMPFKEVNDITLKLLENFFKGDIRRELLLNILFKFSNELSYEQGLDKNIIFKSRSILIRLLMNKNYAQDLCKYIKRCIFHVHKFYLVDTYFSTLSQILDDLSDSQNESLFNYFKFEANIKNYNMLIPFLDEKYKLFPIHMNYLIKIIQLFVFFCNISNKILEELNKGNFDYDNLFNIDAIYSEYIVYRENNLNFSYSLSNNKNNINNNNENGMDIESNNINTNNNSNDIFILEKEFENEIKSKEQEKYIKNLIKDYTEFFKEIITSTNILPSTQELINSIFDKLKIDFPKITYFQIINNIFRSMFWNHLRSGSNFKLNYLNFLYNLSKSIKSITPSLSMYFNLLSDIFQARIEKNNVNLIDEEAMKHLILTQIKNSNDYENLPIPAYKTVLYYVTYVNQKSSNANYSPIIQKFTEIKSFREFWGFDIFWNFYIYTKIDTVQKAALDTIINILELISNKEEDRNHLINTIFSFISKNKNNIKNNPQVKISFVRSLKVISVILGTKINKDIFENKNNNGGNKNIRVLIKNHYFDFKDDENYYINISNEQKVKNLKEFIINQIVCSQSNLEEYNRRIKNNKENNIITEEAEKMNIDVPVGQNILTIEQLKKMVYDTNIMIHYKNTVLKDDFFVADYHIEENSTLLIFKGGGKTEQEFIPSEELLKEGYLAIKTIFGNNLYFGEDIMKASIIKYKGDIENAGLYLTVPENVEILKREIEEKKRKLEQKHDDIICLEEEKINLLIEVLNNNNDQDINRQIWELFSSIKYPENTIKGIIGDPLDSILEITDVNKMILYLDIIDSLIFDGEFCKYNKLNVDQKNFWISNFIKNEGVVKHIFNVLDKLDTKMGNFQLYMILKIFIGWFHKILIKICEQMTDNGENPINILQEVKMLRSLNSHDNIQNNNNANNSNISNNNDENNNDKKNEEFKIINNQEGINFLKILSEIHPEIIFYKLLNLLVSLSFSEEKKILLQKICEFILMSLIIQKNEINKFCSMEKTNKILIKIIIYSQAQIERKVIKNFLKVLVRDLMQLTDPKELQTENNIYTVIFQTFIGELISGLNFNDEFCDIFSDLLVFTTNDIIKKSIEPLIYKFLKEIYILCTNIDKCNDLQRRVLKYETYVTYGCLKYYKDIIINYINNNQKQDYIEFIYDYLFLINKDKNTQKINSYKFKDNFIRTYLYNLLTELISLDNNYLLKLLPKIITHHRKLEILDPNKIETPFDVSIRSPDEKLVGLRNFGSTCYLNSLTQQLFMMPSFRKDLFNNFNITENDLEKLRYSVIYNLQLTFMNLKYGSMSPYPPKRFVKSFLSAFNGEPIQFGIQQDSDEFLSILCDNLEKEAKSYNKENFLENSFKGKIANEILSLEKEYPYYSQSEEPFFRITLDIKGHKSLEEALDAYVKGEILDGDNKYYVDEYKRKISIRKSSSLKILGNEVIIHLKRFEFDFVTFNNYKLSDYLQFPRKINFKKWTRAFLRLNDNPNNKIKEDLLKITDEEKQNLLDENMDYILTGILVHGGSNLQSGHYYSYIMDQETGKWHEFNDNSISDYNIDTDLEKECFGNIGGNNINQYGRTAYLLFYTKKSVFRNQNLFQNIDINKTVLNDVYNENLKYINTNIYLNNNYFNFLKKICTCGTPLLNDKIQNDKGSDLTLNSYLIRNSYIYKKVLSVLKPDDDNSDDSVDENAIINNENEENNITNAKNFEQVYNKCKEEIVSILKQEKEEEKKINNCIYKSKLIKLYFNYIFGLVFPQYYSQNPMNQNQEMVMNAFQTLLEIIKSNPSYSLLMLKQIEKNIPLFSDFIYRYGTTENELSDMAKLILEFFQITFDVIYQYEKENMEMTTDMVKYFVKNDQGKYIIVKEYRSIVMRVIKKLFCDNLEKSRFEYNRISLYLTIFYNFVKSYPETASITINYYFILLSLFTNNSLPLLRSETNPNYIMGNNTGYQVNPYYVSIFCDTVLRCVTPGMKNSNSYSPFFSNRKNKNSDDPYFIDWSKYPSLPNNWEKILFLEFYNYFILFNANAKSKEITCHLNYCDEQTSYKMMRLVCEFSKTKTFVAIIEKVFTNALSVFDLQDDLALIRVDALFELNDKNYEEPVELEKHKTLFEHLQEEVDKSMKYVLIMLYNIGKAIEKYDIINDYFENNKNKLGWIAKFIFKIKHDQITKDKFLKESGFILNQHPDLLQIIQENIIKRFNLE